MLRDSTLHALFARCPPWLWPVLAISLIALREKVRLLDELGASAWEIRLTDWGRAYVSRIHWPGDPPDWKDSLYRTAMGEPVAAPTWQPKPLGLCSDDASADWAGGTGVYALLADAALAANAARTPLGDAPASSPHEGPSGACRRMPSTLRVMQPP